MTDSTRRLKRLYSKDIFGSDFTTAAKEDLPFTWGRMALLEEFYQLNAPGLSERSRQVSDQLGRPLRWKGGLVTKIRRFLGI